MSKKNGPTPVLTNLVGHEQKKVENSWSAAILKSIFTTWNITSFPNSYMPFSQAHLKKWQIQDRIIVHVYNWLSAKAIVMIQMKTSNQAHSITTTLQKSTSDYINRLSYIKDVVITNSRWFVKSDDLVLTTEILSRILVNCFHFFYQ